MPTTQQTPSILIQARITREAYRLLEALAPTPNKRGDMLSTLIVAEVARQIERQKFVQRAQEVCDDAT